MNKMEKKKNKNTLKEENKRNVNVQVEFHRECSHDARRKIYITNETGITERVS